MRFFFFSLFFITVISTVDAQSEFPDLKDYSIQVWTSDQGLPSNNLTQIEQDHQGFLWISSYNGLIRFDGYTFDIYNMEGIPSLKSNGFSEINTNDSTISYFGTLTSGLLSYDGERFDLVKIENDFSGSIGAIYSDGSNKLWVTVKNKGVYFKQYGETSFTLLEHELLQNNVVSDILEISENELWFATNNNGLLRYKDGQVTPISTGLLETREVLSLLKFQSKIYVGTSRGVFEFTNDQWGVVDGSDNYYINDLKVDSFGNLWIATETGILRKNTKGNIQTLVEGDGLPSRQISSIEIDNEGNVWLTSKRGGLVQLKNSNFLNISIDDGLSSQYVNIIHELQDGSFAIGNDNGMVDIYKDGVIKPLNIATELTSISIKDFIQDSQGNFWIATYAGLIRYNGDREHHYTETSGMISRNIRSLFEDSNKNVWIGAKDGGIVKISPQNRIQLFTLEDGLSDNYVFCFEELSDGRILAGTYHGGINIISLDGEITVLNIGLDNSSPLIFNIEVVNDSTYWLATDVGLLKYESGKFRKIDISNGLLVSTIFDVYSDPYGFVWVTSNMGIVRLRGQELNDVLSGKIEQVNARLYDENDGMLSGECTGATRMLISSSGKIWIPTSKGISIVDPAKVYINENIPPLHIKAVSIDDDMIVTDFDKIEVMPGSHRISIDYTALAYYSPAKTTFKYRLRGYEKDWNEVGNRHKATYMNLPDGNFTFEVIASNNDGYWNEVPATVNFQIEPYFYKSRLFILLLTIFVIGIAFLIYWIRIKVVEDKNRELHKLNSELDSFVYSVSHDLRAPLSSILGLISVSKIDSDRTNLPTYLDKIETSVFKLDTFIKEIISYSRNVRLQVDPENINLKEMVEETLESLAYMNTDNAIDISVESPDRPIVSTDKTRVQVILNNIISNAFRYYKPYINDAYIKVKISQSVYGASIVVSDNGIGIKRDQLTKIFDMFYRASESSSGSGLGLYIAKESAAKIDGSIKVHSEYERGTTFTITLSNL